MEEERVSFPDGSGDGKITTVAIYYPPLIPSNLSEDYVGSRIQDDEVSSTIEPPGDDTAADKLSAEDKDPLKEALQSETGKNNVLVTEVSISPEEYPESQSPSTSQPSPSELPKPDSEEILTMTCASQPAILEVGDNETDQKQSLEIKAECLPNLFLDEDDYGGDTQSPFERKVPTEENEEKIIITTSPVVASSEVGLTDKKADHILDLLATLPQCRLILTRCDDKAKGGSKRLLCKSENDFAFDDQLLNNDIEGASKRRDRAAKRKQQNQRLPPKTPLKIERRVRPPKHLVEPGKEASCKAADVGPGKTGHRRRKRRGMAGTVRYSRYNKRLHRLKTSNTSSSNGLLLNVSKCRETKTSKTDHEINLKTETSITPQEIVLLEDEISMMDSCPSPNISDSDSCIEEPQSDETETYLNIITAEDARKFVTAWVNTGEDESSKGFQDSPSKSQQAGSTSAKYDEAEDDEEVPDEVEMKPSILKCSTCFKTFNNPMTLQVHVRLHTGERPYKCKCCGEAFIHYTYLNYHYKNTHGRGESNSSSKAEPMKGKGKLKTDKMPVNPKLSSPISKRNLPASSNKKSEKTNHGQCSSVDQVQSSYICPYCMIRFQHASLLITHLKRHSGAHPFQCRECGQGFKYSRNLKRHIRQAHSISKSNLSTMSNYVEENPEGHLNDDALSSASNLTMRRLELKKSGSKKKQSGITGRKTGKKFNPDSNVNIRRYRCSYCGKKFGSPDGLQTHVRTHTNDRPFQCTHCPIRFIQKVHMMKHVRLIHSGNRHCNYKCTECQGGFQMKGNLDRHMREAHGNQVITKSGAESIPPLPTSSSLLASHTVVRKTLKKRKNRKKKKLYFTNRHNYSFKGTTKIPSMKQTTMEGRPERDILRSYVSLTRCDELVAQLKREKESVNLQKKASEQFLYAKKSLPNESNLSSNINTQRSRNCKTSSQRKPATGGDKSFPCEFCGKTFSHYSSRYMHLRIHNGVKPFKCSICSKAFIQKQSLKVHMRAHAKRNEFPKETSPM